MKTDRTRALRDLILLVVISLLILITSFWLDPFARTISWIYRHDNWNLDVLSTLAIVLAVSLAIYSWRRWRELVAEVRAREKAQEQTRILSATLDDTINEVRTLRGILRICESCQRIQDGSSSWIALEVYVQARSETRFAHGLCPDCARRIYAAKGRNT